MSERLRLPDPGSPRERETSESPTGLTVTHIFLLWPKDFISPAALAALGGRARDRTCSMKPVIGPRPSSGRRTAVGTSLKRHATPAYLLVIREPASALRRAGFSSRKNSPGRRSACASGPICWLVTGGWHGLAGAGSEPAV